MAELFYSGPAALTANQLFKCELTIILEETIGPGGGICVASRHVSDIGDAQTSDPSRENYIEFKTDSAAAALIFEPKPGDHPWNRGFTLYVSDGVLKPGEKIKIIFGGARGYRAQSFIEKQSGFRLGVKTSAGSGWQVKPKKDSYFFEVTGAEAAKIRAYIKSDKTLCVKAEDIYGNTSPVNITLDILLDDDLFIGIVKLNNGLAHIKPGFDVPDDGKRHTLTLTSADGRFFARTNPFGPQLKPGMQVFFGDLHAQSGLCDGTNSPAYLYEYAKTAAGLDFAAVTSHDMEINAGEWSEIKDATREAYVPGEFVTLLGYEWSGLTEAGGDNNIYFAGGDGPLVSNCVYNSPWCNPETPPEQNNLTETIEKIKKIKKTAGGGDFIVIPHFGGRAANFDFYDGDLMPLLEIHSTHKTYEDMWREAVNRRLPFGLCGGSDDHRGAIGDTAVTARERFFSSRCGLTGVYAEGLTRESIWDALKKRRVFVTNGNHMLLFFGLNKDGEEYMMGDYISVKTGAPLAFKFKALCDGFFSSAEIYRDNERARIYSEYHNQIYTYENTYEDTARAGLAFYYVKIIQTDGGAAWSSPIFVEGV